MQVNSIHNFNSIQFIAVEFRFAKQVSYEIYIKTIHPDQECYVMKSKKMQELQGTTKSTVISLITPEHNISYLATAPSQELNYAYTYSENNPSPL